ncbi:MAG: type II secretion system protein [Candidatus Buchananbacteria bacterium]
MIGNKSGLKNNFGFTLLEIVVVLGIFTLIFLVATDIFMMTLKAQRQTSARQQDLSELRFTLDSMVRQIKNSELDYQEDIANPDARYSLDQDAGISGSETELHLIDNQGNRYGYFLDNLGGGVVKVSVNGQETALNDPNAVTVVKLLFYINPATNPFTTERCNNGSSPSGCLNGQKICTIDDNSGQSGYCQCATNNVADNAKCASQNCVTNQNTFLCLPFDYQPRVTIVLGFQSKAVKVTERKTIYLQTSASSRIYKR